MSTLYQLLSSVNVITVVFHVRSKKKYIYDRHLMCIIQMFLYFIIFCDVLQYNFVNVIFISCCYLANTIVIIVVFAMWQAAVPKFRTEQCSDLDL